MSNELKQQKREHLNSQKDNQKSYEQQIKDLTKKNEEQQEAIYEWENKFQDLEQKYD